MIKNLHLEVSIRPFHWHFTYGFIPEKSIWLIFGPIEVSLAWNPHGAYQ